jgi:GDP-4-dehydro-6-deoxy-D-mannose reductase
MVQESFRDSEQYWRVNVDGTRALANMLLELMPETFFIFASSAEVYGLTFQRGVPVNEDGPMAPANPYAASKAAADMALGEMALRGLKLARLRMFNQIGPGQSIAFAVSAFADQIAHAEAGIQPPILKVGSLDHWREFIDVRDGCDAYVAVLNRIGTLPPGVAINIASGAPPRKVGDILNALLARSRLQFKVETEQARIRPTDVVSVSGDITRARELLDWAPKCDWNETLDLILADSRARVAAT